MVTVVIPTTTSGFGHLAKLMPSLSPEKLHTVIVDNDSLDGTAQYLANFDCTVVHNKTKRSFAYSCNQGAKLSDNKYLLFLNNDTRVLPNFALEMVSVAEERNAAVVGCPIFLMEGGGVQHAGIYLTDEGFPYELGRPIPDKAPGIKNDDYRVRQTREVPAVTAVAVLVNREKFWKVGGFDENYLTGWEDVDLCFKLREAGESIWYAGNATVYHKLHGSRNVGRFTYEEQNRDRFCKRWVENGKTKELTKHL